MRRCGVGAGVAAVAGGRAVATIFGHNLLGDQLGIRPFAVERRGPAWRDRCMDWTVTFHHPGGVLRWGTDERFEDLRHLNRAGAAG